MKASAVTIESIHNQFKDVFTGIECFKGTFSLQVKDSTKPYQGPQICVAYTLNNPLKMSWTDC